jgi:hypothetical protein
MTVPLLLSLAVTVAAVVFVAFVMVGSCADRRDD